MRRFSILLFLILLLPATTGAQRPACFNRVLFLYPDGYYSTAWAQVTALLAKRLPQSALEIVEQIYRRAHEERNEQQIIKAIGYRVSLGAELHNDEDSTMVVQLREEIAISGPVTRAILKSALAGYYGNYLHSARWILRNRTDNPRDRGSDFRRWSIAALYDSTRTLYMESLEREDDLRRIAIRDYADILSVAEGSEKLRPTLFDLLAHRAFKYFNGFDYSLLGREEYHLADRRAFLPAAQFAAASFPTPEGTPPKFLALRLMQRLTAAHLNDPIPDPLVDLEIERLTFAMEITATAGDAAAYREALEALRRTTAGTPLETRIIYLLAVESSSQDDDREALRLANEAIARFPDSQGGLNARALRAEILRKELGVTVERTVLPGAPSIASIEFKDIQKVYCRLVDMGADGFGGRAHSHYLSKESDLFRSLLKRKPAREWSQLLPDPDDHKDHRTEIAIPPVDKGLYILLVSPDRGFRTDSNAIAYTLFTATRLSLQSFTWKDSGTVFDVRDAATGAPMPEVNVTIWMRDKVAPDQGTTNRDGRFIIPPPPSGADHYTQMIELQSGDDRLRVDDGIGLEARTEPTTDDRVMLFTDRALYRPGQTIYFKGILYHEDGAIPAYTTLPGRTEKVELIDPNGRSIATATMSTNAFGSFDGTFTAPTGSLTGEMRIRCGLEERGIRVEEYKRPKFEVTLDPLEGKYRLGDSIVARGSARSFAGSAVDGAKVKYTVSRWTTFPYSDWRRRGLGASNDVTLATGALRTDASGKFAIPFPALPDSSANRADLPVFRYTVQVDVTDMNGETSSRTTTIAIGYTSLSLAVTLPEIISTRDPAMLRIFTNNLNGQPVPAGGTVIVEKLREPERLNRERLFQTPDRFAMTREEFTAAFPHDHYGAAPENGTVAERIAIERPFRTDATGRDSLALTELPPGSYRVRVISRDPSGATIATENRTIIHDPRSPRMPTIEPLFVVPPSSALQPGDSAVILYGTSYRDVPVTIEVERDGNVVSEERTIISDEVRRFTLPIVEKDRGGLVVHITFVRDYRIHEARIGIDVPWTSKDLRIETASFRDRMNPGEPEEWRFTIAGAKADSVAAEMVATLYDASLDAIYPNESWNQFRWPSHQRSISISDRTFSIAGANILMKDWNISYLRHGNIYDRLDLYHLTGDFHLRLRDGSPYFSSGDDFILSGVVNSTAPNGSALQQAIARSGGVSAAGRNGYGIQGGRIADTLVVRAERYGDAPSGPDDVPPAGVNIRRNLNETAFFYPKLTTNEKGEITIRFTAPEALTRWRIIGFAHTADMRTGTIEKSAVTQKDLMLLTNAPRFLREGDSVTFAVKISNMTGGELKGTATLQLIDAATMKPLDSAWRNITPARQFTTPAKGSTAPVWSFVVPMGAGAVIYRVTATAGSFSDGEEAPIPVLPNRMLVTETLPMNIRAGQTRTFELAKLTGSSASPTLRNHRLTLEITSNPAWYAIQALPYLMEFPHECTEQTFERFYANSLASHLVNSTPKLRNVFDRWRNADALASNLEKNPEVKSILLEETPWVMQGRDESERKKRIALLFDLNGMAEGLNAAAERLRAMQGSDGGWPWFPGMEADRFITGYIATGFGHLRKLGVESGALSNLEPLMRSAVAYLDNRASIDYETLRATKDFDPGRDYLGSAEAQYLYMRSFFPEIPTAPAHRDAVKFWRRQAAGHWQRMDLMSQGMIALALQRGGERKAAAAIIASLRERAIHSDELGTYWKLTEGWWWYQAPIETQSMLIEAFNEITGDRAMVDEMRIWLLKRKQVEDWGTTKATADACYALLGTDLAPLSDDSRVEATIGGAHVDQRGTDAAGPEAGTGYFKTTWSGGDIRPEMGSVTLSREGSGIGWGALYWQYFEQLDKITPHASPLGIERKLYRVNATDHGEELEPITEQSPLRVGDLLRVRIEIRADRDMEYIHLKDMRGAGLEPVDALSGYRWKNGLGYYMSIRDASMNFFFGTLLKGNHLLEYSLRASHAGVYANGISTVQSMYAPEFAGHTQGEIVRIR